MKLSERIRLERTHRRNCEYCSSAHVFLCGTAEKIRELPIEDPELDPEVELVNKMGTLRWYLVEDRVMRDSTIWPPERPDRYPNSETQRKLAARAAAQAASK